MKGIALATIIAIFSVVIPIQSREIAYTYNYDNFVDLFRPSDSGVDHFHVYKYVDLDKIIDTDYKGTNIGGAFLLEGGGGTATDEFEGYIVDITTSVYCGGTYEEEGRASLLIDIIYSGGKRWNSVYICEEIGWVYNLTWIPPTRQYQGFTVRITAWEATANKVYGFDLLRITTSDTPPQLLQRDNTSSNDP